MRGNSCINIETLIHLLNALPHELGVEFCEIRLRDDTNIILNSDSRDSSEWQPISRMKPDHIRMIDDSPLEFKWKGSSDSPIT